MATALEKARRDPGSMKSRILQSARRLFGEYGFHGVTTRMIAKDVGIDISTLHYHWGDKQTLYEAVVTDLNDEVRAKFIEIERRVRGKGLAFRLEVAIDVMCDHLFAHPEASQLMLQSYFSKTRNDEVTDTAMSEHITNIALAMGLGPDRTEVSPEDIARVLALWNSAINFTSGEALFRPLLDVERERYIAIVKDTLKFILIPAFTGEKT